MDSSYTSYPLTQLYPGDTYVDWIAYDMSLECRDCERDLRGEHAPDCKYAGVNMHKFYAGDHAVVDADHPCHECGLTRAEHHDEIETHAIPFDDSAASTDVVTVQFTDGRAGGTDGPIIARSGTITIYPPTAIPMVLYCPECHAQHIDSGEWVKTAHRTHKCAECGVEFRPANVSTVGVEQLPEVIAEPVYTQCQCCYMPYTAPNMLSLCSWCDEHAHVFGDGKTSCGYVR